jgi:hypothetical protein
MRGQTAHYYEYLLIGVEYSSAALFKPTHLMITQPTEETSDIEEKQKEFLCPLLVRMHATTWLVMVL